MLPHDYIFFLFLSVRNKINFFFKHSRRERRRATHALAVRARETQRNVSAHRHTRYTRGAEGGARPFAADEGPRATLAHEPALVHYSASLEINYFFELSRKKFF